MNNFIIGSGLIAFLIKEILPEYTIIPIGKSRFFQYNIPTCDDYIFCTDTTDKFIKSISSKLNSNVQPILFKRSISYCGEIIHNKHQRFLDMWSNKIYNKNIDFERFKFEGFVYNISSGDIFKILEQEHKNSFYDFIKENNKLLSIDIDNKIIHTKNCSLQYDNIINTIPLDVMFKFCGLQEYEFESKDLHTFVLKTDELDFENSSELLVVDDSIDFYKCTRIGKNIFQFYSTIDITNITQYMNLMVKNFDLLSGTAIKNAIPISCDTADLSKYDIISVGSCAQWDDLIDISDCIEKIKKLRN